MAEGTEPASRLASMRLPKRKNIADINGLDNPLQTTFIRRKQ
ncbi:MAG: hypothetical protein ACKOPI_02365 [bacterium]